jgi:enoyl-CoA hydratase
MDSVFGLHHFAHAHNAETSADSLGGMDAKSMAAGGRASGGFETVAAQPPQPPSEEA